MCDTNVRSGFGDQGVYRCHVFPSGRCLCNPCGSLPLIRGSNPVDTSGTDLIDDIASGGH